MSGIAAPLASVKTLLRTIPVTGGDGLAITPTVRTWNNQVQYMRNADGARTVSFPLPAFFPEVTPDAVFEDIGQGYRAADLGIRIHIVSEQLDGGDDTFDDNDEVFALRDKVIGYLTGARLAGCGELVSVGEAQEYDHDNVYHYTVDFVCNFIDSKGSRYDPDKPDAYIEKAAPTTLSTVITTEEGGGTNVKNKFIINENTL